MKFLKLTALGLIILGSGSCGSPSANSLPIPPTPAPGTACIPITQPIGFTITNAMIDSPLIFDVVGGNIPPNGYGSSMYSGAMMFGEWIYSQGTAPFNSNPPIGTVALSAAPAAPATGGYQFNRTNVYWDGTQGDSVSFNITPVNGQFNQNYNFPNSSYNNVPGGFGAGWGIGFGWMPTPSPVNVQGVFRLGTNEVISIATRLGVPVPAPGQATTLCAYSVGMALSVVPGINPRENEYGNFYVLVNAPGAPAATGNGPHGGQIHF